MLPPYEDVKRPCSPEIWRHGRFVRWSAALFLAVLLSACSSVQPSPEVARVHQTRAEALFDEEQIPAALEAMRAAYQADPNDPRVALRLGELYEFVDQPEAALALYRRTLSQQQLSTVIQDELTYRSALLCALKLNRVETAYALAATLPNGPRQNDLQAVLLLSSGDPRGALLRLNEVRQHPLEQGLAARVSLHAAQAYIALGAFDEALAALYQAINLSGRSVNAHDVQKVWDDLKLRVGQQ